MKIKIKSGNIEALAELKDTPTANAIYTALPIEGAANTWGDEIYFVVPVDIKAEDDTRDVVEEGDIAYWPEGKCFCVFFGKTPASKGDEVRAASKVNIFGKIIGDSKIFTKVKDSDLVILEKA